MFFSLFFFWLLALYTYVLNVWDGILLFALLSNEDSPIRRLLASDGTEIIVKTKKKRKSSSTSLRISLSSITPSIWNMFPVPTSFLPSPRFSVGHFYLQVWEKTTSFILFLFLFSKKGKKKRKRPRTRLFSRVSLSHIMKRYGSAGKNHDQCWDLLTRAIHDMTGKPSW